MTGAVNGMSVAVIGCGNIGSRSLQALCGIGQDNRIFAVDPDEASLETARARTKEVTSTGLPEISFAQDLGSLPGEIDLAIVATCANIRLDVTEKLLRCSRVRNVILEKFLFQRYGDYARMDKLLEQHGAGCWVSLPRRVWPGYVEMKERLGAGPVDMIASGHDFRLASNAIHLIDTYCFVTETPVSRLDTSGLADAGGSNRRDGFRELYGTLIGESADGGRLILTSKREGSIPFTMQFISATAHYIIHETDGRATYSGPDTDGEWKDIPFGCLYMSEMAPAYASVLRGEGCGLPSFQSSAPDHLALLEAFNRHWFGENWKDHPCPVT